LITFFRFCRNAFTYFVLNYCDRNPDVATAEWTTMSAKEKHNVTEEWTAAKKKFIKDLQDHIVSRKSVGSEFKEEDIIPCPIRYADPDSD
jgi:hypothetical protein